MSASFWVSLIVWVLSGLELVCDLRETLTSLRAATEPSERRWIRFKLAVMWVLFFAAFSAVAITGWESMTSDKKFSTLESKIGPQPLNLKIQALLNEIDPHILVELRTNPVRGPLDNVGAVWVDKPLTQSQLDKLWEFCTATNGYLGIHPDPLNGTLTYKGMVYTGLKFVVFDRIFESTTNRNQTK